VSCCCPAALPLFLQLGTLPPQFFTVTISTVGENMSQLMLSVLMTGYMFRNAQYRCAHNGNRKSRKSWKSQTAAATESRHQQR
jgi:hypothetical protein